jgi:hypothetical protein
VVLAVTGQSPPEGVDFLCVGDVVGALRCHPPCSDISPCSQIGQIFGIDQSCCDLDNAPGPVCKLATDSDANGICDQPLTPSCNQTYSCNDGLANNDGFGTPHEGDEDRIDCADATCRGPGGTCANTCPQRDCNDGSHNIGAECTLLPGFVLGTCYAGPDRLETDSDPLCRGDCICKGSIVGVDETLSTTPDDPTDCPCITLEQIQGLLTVSNQTVPSSCVVTSNDQPRGCGAELPCWAANTMTGPFGGVAACTGEYVDESEVTNSPYLILDSASMACVVLVTTQPPAAPPDLPTSFICGT